MRAQRRRARFGTAPVSPCRRGDRRCRSSAPQEVAELRLDTPGAPHRPDGGKSKSIRQPWGEARDDAGYQHKILRDFRRTAVRDLERAGVPRSTAMQMVGHKTESLYRRYAIVDGKMHRKAAAKLNVKNAEQKRRLLPNAKASFDDFKARQR